MQSSPFPAPRHDHGTCIADGLARAEAVCRSRGERLTENRQQVLELLLAEHRPAGAYEILERFDWKDRRPAPAQIYRALAFLETMGVVHRIASRNVYVACSGQGEGHGTVFLVCEQCGTVAEPSAAGLRGAVRDLADKSDFELRRHTLEVTGRCPECVRADEA
ncbi:MAG: transcriptional repressor [Alphaproteobacteria bacterium]|nr:transcriptional repressor [Alphaproteobacteria bacterium]